MRTQQSNLDTAPGVKDTCGQHERCGTRQIQGCRHSTDLQFRLRSHSHEAADWRDAHARVGVGIDDPEVGVVLGRVLEHGGLHGRQVERHVAEHDPPVEEADFGAAQLGQTPQAVGRPAVDAKVELAFLRGVVRGMEHHLTVQIGVRIDDP